MPADAPTILATSGGRIDGRRTPWEVGPLTKYAVELARVSGRRPRVCFLATALGDNAAVLQAFYDAARFAGFEASHLALFPMPNVDDPRAHLLAQDVVWVWGGGGRRGPDRGLGRVHLLARRRDHRLLRS